MPRLRRRRGSKSVVAPVRRRRLRRLLVLSGLITSVAAWRNREVNRNLRRTD